MKHHYFQKTFVKCLNCEEDLLVPEGAFKIFCTNCSNIFTLSKQTNQHRIDILHFFAN